MQSTLILASASTTRAKLLRAAAIDIEPVPARLDEAAMTQAMLDEGATPRDLSDVLADRKARKVSARYPDRLVLGCDQVLSIGDRVFGKPETPQAATTQLQTLRNTTHQLHSAAVLYREAAPVWRHVDVVSLTMRHFSDAYLHGYVQRNWHEIRHCAGAYQLESEGARLFTRISGDYFSVLGLPLLPLLDYLIAAEVIES